ncbi:MAG: replication-associated recombination protein A [bacterium]
MRPQNLEEFVGQQHLLGPGKILRRALEQGRLFSALFWGPPGCGKTALALLLSRRTASHFVAFSAVLSGVKEIREVIQEAEIQWSRRQKKTVLFVDEIHRFNKSQQDAFLPHVESGRLVLMGATTENPSFEVNKALQSRMRLLVLYPLSEEEIGIVVQRALNDADRGLGRSGLRIDAAALQLLCRASQGDARRALNTIEIAAALVQDRVPHGAEIRRQDVEEALQEKALIYDKSGEEHYNLISAFIKSLRGSDPDAALYWMTRMLEAGEDPLFIVRRMVIFASEDVGNADPAALSVAVAAKEAVHFVGVPEATLNLAQAATYLATAPKSNASYVAYVSARKAVRERGSLPVPLHLRNAPTAWMKEQGYGKDYAYPHDAPEGYVPVEYLPEELTGEQFYHPVGRGYEQKIRERLARWRALRSARRSGQE